MTKGIQNNEPDARIVYADIIDLPYHPKGKMSLYDRAAQFAPFAALSGYDDMVTEEARMTGEWKERDTDALDRKIAQLLSALASGKHTLLTFTYFIPDEKKDGGEYKEISGKVKKVDVHRKEIILYAANEISDGEAISIPLIYDIISPAEGVQ